MLRFNTVITMTNQTDIYSIDKKKELFMGVASKQGYIKDLKLSMQNGLKKNQKGDFHIAILKRFHKIPSFLVL